MTTKTETYTIQLRGGKAVGVDDRDVQPSTVPANTVIIRDNTTGMSHLFRRVDPVTRNRMTYEYKYSYDSATIFTLEGLPKPLPYTVHLEVPSDECEVICFTVPHEPAQTFEFELGGAKVTFHRTGGRDRNVYYSLAKVKENAA